MASVPPQQGPAARSPATGANNTPLGPRHSTRLLQQAVTSVSPAHRSDPLDEAVDGAPSTGANLGPMSPNGAVSVTQPSNPDVVQGAPTVLAQTVQLHDQAAHVPSSSIAAPSAVNVQNDTESVLGKRKQSDASVVPTKRTKTDVSNTALDVDNKTSLHTSLNNSQALNQEGSNAEPQSRFDEGTQRINDARPGRGIIEDTPRSDLHSSQAVPSVDGTTNNPQRHASDIAENATAVSHASPERSPPRPTGRTVVWPSHDDDHAAFEALQYLEDPKRQEGLAKHHRGRAVNVARGLLEEVYDQIGTATFDEADGWMKSATHSRNMGRSEIGLIAEFPMPVLRADPTPPSTRTLYWVPGPAGLLIMCKMSRGVIVFNDRSVKTMKPFTTKSGTDIGRLRSSGDLAYYVQVKLSPDEEGVPTERGVFDVFMFEAFNIPGLSWDIDGPRFMEKMFGYQHPHGQPYRIVGSTKPNGYDEDLLVELWKMNYELGAAQTHAAFKERYENPDWFRRYRTVPRSRIGDDTVVAESRALPLADNASNLPGPNAAAGVNAATVAYDTERGTNAADEERAAALALLFE